MIAKTKIWYNS